MPSQEIAYLVSENSNVRLYIVDVAHALGYRIANAPLASNEFDWSPDGTHLVFASNVADSTEIFVVGTDGYTLRELTITEAYEYFPSWSPDGQHIVFNRQPLDPQEFTELVIMNTADRQERVLTNSPEVETSPVWSPDGTQIAYIAHSGLYPAIKIVDAQTGELRSEMNELAGVSQQLSWSPDGTRLVFTVTSATLVIYVMDISANRIFRLTDPAQDNFLPAWSPDGTQIVFVSERNLTSEIFVMHADGSDQRRLVDNPNTLAGYPAWSPDGSRIAFTSASGYSDGDIYVVNVDGSGLQRIATTPFDERLPRWRP